MLYRAMLFSTSKFFDKMRQEVDFTSLVDPMECMCRVDFFLEYNSCIYSDIIWNTIG